MLDASRCFHLHSCASTRMRPWISNQWLPPISVVWVYRLCLLVHSHLVSIVPCGVMALRHELHVAQTSEQMRDVIIEVVVIEAKRESLRASCLKQLLGLSPSLLKVAIERISAP